MLQELIQKAHEGNKEARDRLILENTGLIWNVVRRYMNRGQEAEDLFQIGCIGLMKAVERFDLSYNVRFSTYAVPLIIGEIRRFLRDDGMLKVSRTIKETAVRARQSEAGFQMENGRDPTISELAERMHISEEELIIALNSSGEVESLSKVVYQKDGSEMVLMDRIPSEDNEHDRLIDRMALKAAMRQLCEQEKKIIALRYYYGQTQVQTACCMGISQVQVSRIEKKVLRRLRQIMEN